MLTVVETRGTILNMTKKKETLESILRRLVQKAPVLNEIHRGSGISRRILIRFRDGHGNITLRNAQRLMDYFEIDVVELGKRKGKAVT